MNTASPHQQTHAPKKKRLASEKDAEYNDNSPSSTKSRKRRRKSKKLTKQDFINHFHLTQPEAARSLDVCLTTFKNQFSKYPLRWPTPSERKLLIKQRRRQNLPNESFEAFVENMTVHGERKGAAGTASQQSSSPEEQDEDFQQAQQMILNAQGSPLHQGTVLHEQHFQTGQQSQQFSQLPNPPMTSDNQIDQMMQDLQSDIENQKRKNELLRMLISQQNDVLREISMSYQGRPQGLPSSPVNAHSMTSQQHPGVSFAHHLTPQQALFAAQNAISTTGGNAHLGYGANAVDAGPAQNHSAYSQQPPPPQPGAPFPPLLRLNPEAIGNAGAQQRDHTGILHSFTNMPPMHTQQFSTASGLYAHHGAMYMSGVDGGVSHGMRQ